ncbi:MAG: DUF4240 domain-containing protein [Planctomycetota bacterium]
MDESQFWSIIAGSRSELSQTAREGNFARQLDNISTLLAELPDADLVEFDRLFTTRFYEAYRWDLWGAAYLIGGGCSDDGFMDFRAWLISMGREVYESAIRNPDSLADVYHRKDFDDYFFEDFLSVTLEIQDGPVETVHVPHPGKPAGEKWDEDDLEQLYPRLAALHG